jgi:hypothetical protein
MEATCRQQERLRSIASLAEILITFNTELTPALQVWNNDR